MVCRRWEVGKTRSRCRGLNQDSGARSQNEEHLLSACCLLPTAFCVRGEFELGGPLPRDAVYDKMSSPTGKEKTSNFKN